MSVCFGHDTKMALYKSTVTIKIGYVPIVRSDTVINIVGSNGESQQKADNTHWECLFQSGALAYAIKAKSKFCIHIQEL